MVSDASALVVPRRFRGPATSGNGGFTAGSLALALAPDVTRQPPVRVRLSAPPPLDTPLTLARDGAALVASAAGTVVASATALDDVEAHHALDAVPAVPFGDALAAGERYPGLHDHPFPECFACGTARSEGDGLRLRPGPVAGRDDGLVAAAWVPGESEVGFDGIVPVPLIWAALDCPGGWSVDVAGRPMVLGTMTAWVLARPGFEERCVVTARVVELTDRKALTASSLYGAAGDLLAMAAHVWVAVDPASFGAQS